MGEDGQEYIFLHFEVWFLFVYFLLFGKKPNTVNFLVFKCYLWGDVNEINYLGKIAKKSGRVDKGEFTCPETFLKDPAHPSGTWNGAKNAADTDPWASVAHMEQNSIFN